MAMSSHTYDVFLSFRGEDTRKTFTSHLYNSLKKMKIRTFMDERELKKGKEIHPTLAKAIEESRVSIVVISKNYAFSAWCLNELKKIVECKNTKDHVIKPIFFEVTPSEVRDQKAMIGEALAKHKQNFSMEKVQEWRKALHQVANLAGWTTTDRNQSDLIEEIVKHINIQVKRVPVISIPEHLVGIDAHLSKIESHLDIENTNEVRMLGIYGPQGVGKSTLAKVFYYKHFSEFECWSFVECISERIKGKYDIVEVQKALLSEILGDSSLFACYNREEGAKMIEDVLSSKRVLLVLDDVDDIQQLEKLAGGFHWFGPGSRIIITTQKAKLLHNYKVHFTYEMKGMNPAEAVRLFSWHAFKRNEPEDQCSRELTNAIVTYTKGIPSVLVKLGTDLFSERMSYRQSEVDGENKQVGLKCTPAQNMPKEMFKQGRECNVETRRLGTSSEQILREHMEPLDMNVQEECFEVEREDDDFKHKQLETEEVYEEESEDLVTFPGSMALLFQASALIISVSLIFYFRQNNCILFQASAFIISVSLILIFYFRQNNCI
ncbi:TMV resistance protein N-like [Quercus lobata]|uniref:TMV resistance protein N-like n=1 Tax=Quercus lobata TaxID=97700 RepID=UPI001246F5AA|nr:TMV resistance protein N-like [Quercus lobata]